MIFERTASLRRHARMWFGVTAAAAGLLGAAACSDTPIEALTLSETAIQELDEAHRAHRALAERYFARMKDDVDVFVNEIWRPYFVERTLLDTSSGRDAGAVVRTVEEITERIALFRAALMEPVDAQERATLRGIDDIYAQARQAHAILVGRLASDERIERAQDMIRHADPLRRVRHDHINASATLSQQVEDLVARVRRGDVPVAESAAQLCEIVYMARGQVDGVATGTPAGAETCRSRIALPRE